MHAFYEVPGKLAVMRGWATVGLVLGTLLPLVELVPSGAHAQSSEEKAFDLTIQGGQVVGGTKSVRVTEGDKVTLNMISDAAIEVHLHGYDIEAEVAPGAPARMSFEAFATGRFPVSVHGADQHESTLLYLEVYPR